MTAASETRRLLRVGETPRSGPVDAGSLERAIQGTVVVETDFPAALDRVTEGDVDGAVVDHHPAGFDGIAFLRAVRQDLPSFPVVLVPATEDGGVARQAVDENVTAYVPASDDDALGIVAERVEQHVMVRSGESGRVRMPISDLTAEEEQRLKERAMDEAPVGMTIADATLPDEPLIYVNDAFERITGYTKEETIGVNCRFLQGPDTEIERTHEIRDALDTGEPVSVELRNYRKDGTLFWNQLKITPIRGKDGEVTNYVAFQQDITERKEAEFQIERERERLQRLLDRINGLIGDVTEIVVTADSTDDIYERAVERIGDDEAISRAWIGEYDPGAHVVRRRADGDDMIDLTADDAAPLATAVDEQSLMRLDDSLAGPVRCREGEEGVVIPLTYRRTTYGVLAVYSRTQSFDEEETTVLQALGRSIGAAINDLLSKQTVTTDTVIEIGVELHDETTLTRLSEALGDGAVHENTLIRHDGDLLLLFEVEGDIEAVVTAAESIPDVIEATVLADDDDPMVEVAVESPPFVNTLSEYGAQITTVEFDANAVKLRFRVATEQNGRAIVDELENNYETVELVAYHESDQPAQTRQGFRATVEDELTARQLTALQKAYVSGFFEWPRRSDGDQLAASMDVVPSTFYQHLRAAEKKLLTAFFEGQS
ncbi:bacterio-opsin activator domain-containing protein [Halapricum hydrolyticum]|uniref:PAS domain-containing protein n=1 Tax=Halapricum hydrolyticum TaxID=2979991 RepID=A0AAE3IDI6_9EURY|nr:bacterio-opsin activator domain-containing protein [Halapricum hydrolyticum]MCU4719397.1 PAS domain-containing protein [Halapricum hydrolyticum]MCU4728406.1 PAS domain-containing protein [Halapricum hydrolyticum]